MSTCEPHHDLFAAVLTTGLCIGLVASYLPQHYRIIANKSSEGFSPWYLLLGSTSSAGGMLNIITLQWGIIQCCPKLSFGSCLESIGVIIQVFLTWTMFTLILVLYMVYFPPHLKYVDTGANEVTPKALVKTEDWKVSVTLSWVVAIHFFFCLFVTLLLLVPGKYDQGQISTWAGFLGVSSACLTSVQYTPQLVHTFRTKLVGALSIPMMLIQTPGAVLMVTSIALRPGVNWTSWITFAVAGVMQGALLLMCIKWHYRQKKEGIDDFGRPVTVAAGERAPLLGSN